VNSAKLLERLKLRGKRTGLTRKRKKKSPILAKAKMKSANPIIYRFTKFNVKKFLTFWCCWTAITARFFKIIFRLFLFQKRIKVKE